MRKMGIKSQFPYACQDNQTEVGGVWLVNSGLNQCCYLNEIFQCSPYFVEAAFMLYMSTYICVYPIAQSTPHTCSMEFLFKTNCVIDK